MESTIDDYVTIADNAGILEEKRLTGYNRDDIMFFVDGSLAQLVEHLTLNPVSYTHLTLPTKA